MILSILICAIESRKDMLTALLSSLSSQGNFDVEIIYDIDNKQVTTGFKRQRLLEKAKGDYICFIDEDDEVPDYYISEILKALQTKPDCVGMSGYMTTNGANKIEWVLSKDLNNRTVFKDGEPLFTRTTNHLSPVRRELALQAGFPNKSEGEDAEYSIRLKPLLKTEVVINKSMYHYKFETFNKSYK